MSSTPTATHGRRVMAGTEVESAENLRLQLWFWRFQRVGWILFTLILVAAMLGLFGDGPMSKVTVRGSRGWRLDYDRYARAGLSAWMQLQFAEAREGELVVHVDKRLAALMSADNVMPVPLRMESRPDQLIMAFDFKALAAAGWIRWQVVHDAAGAFEGWVAIDDGPPVTVRQWVYP